jgi:EAL domain-containing protein (putative c-di-GMP-specific phosphodiesterase class I)
VDTPSNPEPRVLVVDDDPVVTRSLARVLRGAGFEVETADSGAAAIEHVRRSTFDVVVSDITMPEMDGIELLRAIRAHDLDLPVLLLTGAPALESAIGAVEYGAFKYLTKPAADDELISNVGRASQLHRLARTKREAMSLAGEGHAPADRAGLEASFESALSSLWMAFQPIVRASEGDIHGYEALLRSNEPALPHPGAVLDAAERLSALDRLGRIVRERAATPMLGADPLALLFVNLHPNDLLDDSLYDTASPIGRLATRTILEITERATLASVPGVRERVAHLRRLGYRIAIDDLGAGYAGLTSFTQLEPDVVKLDMSLVRDVDKNVVKRRVVRSMVSLCRDMGMLVVAEGVETKAECDVLVGLGCDLLQGYLFAKPGRPFPSISW